MKQFGRKLHNGYQYLRSWPVRPELNVLFPENRIVLLTSFALQVMPLLAAVTVSLPVIFERYRFLPQSLMTALFFLFLPVQGLLWLELRAKTPLPLSLNQWYRQLQHKLEEQGASFPVKSRLCYQDLALLLKEAYRRLDRSFMMDQF